MSAELWDDDSAAADQVAHLGRQRQFTLLSGVFWSAGLLWHILETGLSGALSLFAGHGEEPMPVPEAGLFALTALMALRVVAAGPPRMTTLAPGE